MHKFNKDDYLKMLQEKLTTPATAPVPQQPPLTRDPHEALQRFLKKRRNGGGKAIADMGLNL